jgi:Rho-binding antiterminator
MSDYKPIDCDLHDYVEIACMHGYRLLIELTNGTHFNAKALTTRSTATKEEFLVLEGNATHSEVRLDRLLAITPLDRAAVFGRVVLSGRK